MQAAQGTLEKPVELRQLRQEIARMKTILKEKDQQLGKHQFNHIDTEIQY